MANELNAGECIKIHRNLELGWGRCHLNSKKKTRIFIHLLRPAHPKSIPFVQPRLIFMIQLGFYRMLWISMNARISGS